METRSAKLIRRREPELNDLNERRRRHTLDRHCAAESDNSLTGRVEPYPHSQALGGRSGPPGCSGIAMAVCGSEHDRGLVHVHQGRTDVFSRSDGLSGDHIYSLFEDREGNIWVATVTASTAFASSPIATISVKQGLSNDVVASVLAARDGSVWLGTADGLNRWNDGQITIYRKRSERTAR